MVAPPTASCILMKLTASVHYCKWAGRYYIAGLFRTNPAASGLWINSALNLYNGNSWQSFLQGDRIADIAQDRTEICAATDHGVIEYDGITFRVYDS